MNNLTIQDKRDLWDIYYNLTRHPMNDKEWQAALALKGFLERKEER